MMLGQRQVTDGKVKSSLCMFYFDCNLLVLLSEIKLIFIRPVNMCGKRMRKFTWRSRGLDQPSEASVLTRWETNAYLPVSMLRFLFWFWKCMPSLKTNSSSRYVHVDRGLTVAYMDPTVQNGLWPCRWPHFVDFSQNSSLEFWSFFFLPGMQQSRNMLCPTVWHPRYVLHGS